MPVPLRKKELFFNVRKKVPIATKLGVGLKALVAGPLRKELLFSGLPLLHTFLIMRGEGLSSLSNEPLMREYYRSHKKT